MQTSVIVTFDAREEGDGNADHETPAEDPQREIPQTHGCLRRHRTPWDERKFTDYGVGP